MCGARCGACDAGRGHVSDPDECSRLSGQLKRKHRKETQEKTSSTTTALVRTRLRLVCHFSSLQFTSSSHFFKRHRKGIQEKRLTRPSRILTRIGLALPIFHLHSPPLPAGCLWATQSCSTWPPCTICSRKTLPESTASSRPSLQHLCVVACEIHRIPLQKAIRRTPPT